jgi:hypothetical protein
LSPLNDFHIEGSLNWNDYMIPEFTGDTLKPYFKPHKDLTEWCAWTRHGLSLAVVADHESSKQITCLRMKAYRKERPLAQHSANIVIRALRTFPTMMLRKETFPWFIHQQSHLLNPPSNEDRNLPEALSTCMGIAQIYASGSTETKSFAWRTMRAHCQRAMDDLQGMSQADLLCATQACMVYLVMCIIDPGPDDKIGQELISALFECYMHSKSTFGIGHYELLSTYRPTWAEWILAESQRRYLHHQLVHLAPS